MNNVITNDELAAALSNLEIGNGIFITDEEVKTFYAVCTQDQHKTFLDNLLATISVLHEVKPLHDGNYFIIDQLIHAHLHVVSEDRLCAAYNRNLSTEKFLRAVLDAVDTNTDVIVVNDVAHTMQMGWLYGAATFGKGSIEYRSKNESLPLTLPASYYAYMVIGALDGFDHAHIKEVWNKIGLTLICPIEQVKLEDIATLIPLIKYKPWKGKLPYFNVYTEDPVCIKVCNWALEDRV